MLDIKLVRDDPTGIAEALERKNHEFPAPHFIELDARRKAADIRAQNLLAERKSASKKIGVASSKNWLEATEIREAEKVPSGEPQ